MTNFSYPNSPFCLSHTELEGGAEFILRDNLTGGQADELTRVRARLSADKFSFSFRIDAKEIFPRGAWFNDKLYLGDVAEIMLTLGDPLFYLELEVNPEGLGYAALVRHEKKGSFSADPIPFPFSYSASRHATGWCAEFDISLDALRPLGFCPNDFRLALYRQQFTAAGVLKLYALSPTFAPSFHKPEFFIRIHERRFP